MKGRKGVLALGALAGPTLLAVVSALFEWHLLMVAVLLGGAVVVPVIWAVVFNDRQISTRGTITGPGGMPWSWNAIVGLQDGTPTDEMTPECCRDHICLFCVPPGTGSSAHVGHHN